MTINSHPTIEPQLKTISAFTVCGITVRTRNSDEMNPATAKLGQHWQRFFSENLIQKIPDQLENNNYIYGVYSDYASDMNDDYNLTAGKSVTSFATENFSHTKLNNTKLNNLELNNITINSGNYLIFTATGQMPDVVINIWKNIWQYFQKHSDIKRKYKTDFEEYQSAETVSVYIGVE